MADMFSHYLEQAANPQLKAKLRKLAGEYRDQALELLDRAVASTPLIPAHHVLLMRVCAST